MSFVPRENLVEAIKKAIVSSPPRRFKQSVDLVIVLRDINPRAPEGRIREIVFLPHPPKKHVSICVVADGDVAVKAREYADRVITREELQQIDRKMAKKIAERCDWVLVKTDLMGLAGRILGPALGPRGKIPVPMPPNVDIKAYIERYRSAVMVRTRDQPQVMVRIGTEDMSPEELADNAIKVLQTVEGKLPNPVHNIARVIVKTTMGPPIEVRLR